MPVGDDKGGIRLVRGSVGNGAESPSITATETPTQKELTPDIEEHLQERECHGGMADAQNNSPRVWNVEKKRNQKSI